MEALLFDVQGTATDFHTTVRDALARNLGRRYPRQNWSAFVNDWRAGYFERLRSLAATTHSWTPIGAVYRSALDALLTRHGMASATENERAEINRAWRRLKP